MADQNYYNYNSESYYKSTFFLDMQNLYSRFEKYLSPGSKILDAGCGPGRDIKYFLGKGYDVKGFDSSEEMVSVASKINGGCILKIEFNQLECSNEFDGIWSCASLLHVPKREINSVFKKIINALKPGGVWYLSFKYGELERMDGERFFNDYTFASLEKELNMFNNIKVMEMWLNRDNRPESGVQWLNSIIKKTS